MFTKSEMTRLSVWIYRPGWGTAHPSWPQIPGVYQGGALVRKGGLMVWRPSTPVPSGRGIWVPGNVPVGGSWASCWAKVGVWTTGIEPAGAKATDGVWDGVDILPP